MPQRTTVLAIFVLVQWSNSTPGYSLSLEIVVDHDEGSALAGMTTYRMYVNTPTSNDILHAIFGDDERPLIVSTTTSFYQDPAGGVLGSDVQPALFGFFPSLEFDSWVTIGLDGEAGPGEQPPSTIGQQTNAWESNFEDGLDLLMQDDIGGAIFLSQCGLHERLVRRGSTHLDRSIHHRWRDVRPHQCANVFSRIFGR